MAGGVQMSLANGVNVFDYKMTKEVRAILNARTKTNKDRQEFHELLSELGLLNKGVVARDLQGLAGDLATRKKGLIVGKIDWAADKIGLKKNSSLLIAENYDDLEKIKNKKEFFKNLGYESKLLSAQETLKIEPELNSNIVGSFC